MSADDSQIWIKNIQVLLCFPSPISKGLENKSTLAVFNKRCRHRAEITGKKEHVEVCGKNFTKVATELVLKTDSLQIRFGAKGKQDVHSRNWAKQCDHSRESI